MEVEAQRRAARLRRGLADDLRGLREDAGVSKAALSVASGVDAGFICRIENGTERPSLETYSRLAAALGADLSTRIYPGTGPAIRDRHQARISEAMLTTLHPRWRAVPEVAVRSPVRGWIDLVLHDLSADTVVAVEVESELRRIEQLLRWHESKAAALPSWEGWPRRELPRSPSADPEVSRLLVVRRTRATRQATREFSRLLRSAYPARSEDALEALTGVGAWPGSAMLWARIDAGGVRLVGGS